MDFRILGSLEVLDEGREVALGGSKQRALLSVLLLHANETLSTDRLIDELWGERPPATAAKTVQVHISRLRKALAGEGRHDPIVTREHGYQLQLDPDRLDARRFERLVAEGADAVAQGSPQRATGKLEEALSLWRGAPLTDLAYEPVAQGEIARLTDLRTTALEQLIEAKLALGRHGEVVGQLETLVAEHPYRERLRAQLMIALYRSDRQADALQAYQNARITLVEELGIEPGERLRDLERAVLAQDPALAMPALPTERSEPGAAPPAVEPAPVAALDTRSARRLVSIVFADLVGSTGLAERLDPESMHRLLDRFTEVCGAVIEQHGGSVEGFIGDAVVGVFGLAELHEDDALRAVRAAVDLCEAGAALSAELERERGTAIAMKLGVESGEVFVSVGERRSSFAAGDAFNVASRLQDEASPGEVLLGDNAYRLVRDSVRAERLEPLALRGRTAKVQAWRLLAVGVEDRPPSAPRNRFVNRVEQLDELRAAFLRAREESALQAVTVVGPPGIGKSRLAHEIVSEVGDEATALVGRCPSYGEGAAYRPLAEIVRQLSGDGDPGQRVSELLEGDESVARLVLGAIGLGDGAVQAEETFWAIRSLLERVARERPLALVVEDVHWAEPNLLDLLEYLVAFSSGHPILLVCLARPEFVQARPAWMAPQPNRSLLLLEALGDSESHELVHLAGAELGSETAARIVATAEGNPLFLEQLVAVGAENGETGLPSSIQAVLAARIDRLEAGERAVLELGSVQGRSFYVGAVEELLAELDRSDIAANVVSLVHKGLIRAERTELPGQDAFRFSHALIREAAYQGLPRQRRAELHERVAHWLERWPGPQDETVGHHLAEACLQLARLGPVGERERALAAAAAKRLASAADAALLRGDPLAGARLLERAESLFEPGHAERAELLPALGAALFEAGRMADAMRVLDEAIAGASDPRLRARSQVERELVRLEAETSVGTSPARQVADAIMPVLEAAGDDHGRSRVWLLRGQLDWSVGRVESADGAWREAADSARRAGHQRELFEVIGWRALAAALGPTPVDEAIPRCEEFRALVRASPFATASTLNPLALLRAMQGEFDIAERLLDQAGEILHELGGLGSGVSHLEAWVRLLAGQPARAEASLREGVETLSSMSEGGTLATTTALLAQAVYAQGRMEEAAELCRTADRIAAADDVMTQVIRRGVEARILAGEGHCGKAEALAREAVALADPTDLLTHRGDAMLDLAHVLRVCERDDEADRATRDGLAQYELKGNAAAAAQARSPD